jgi:hypothetical protein
MRPGPATPTASVTWIFALLLSPQGGGMTLQPDSTPARKRHFAETQLPFVISRPPTCNLCGASNPISFPKNKIK